MYSFRTGGSEKCRRFSTYSQCSERMQQCWKDKKVQVLERHETHIVFVTDWEVFSDSGLPSSRAQLASSSTSRLLASRQLHTGSSAPASATCRQTLCNFGNSRAGCVHAVFSSQDSHLSRGISTTGHAAASVCCSLLNT